ncbi:MAG TPA: hypothetical protein VMA13_08085 [Candidatus Saccharimonadales bacterium]|nr:hypothetical protein [Candidatus Saccharimonadales bacterium]
MKTKSTISVLVSIMAVAGLCGCASSSSQKSSQPTQTSTNTTAEATQTPAKPKEKPIEQRLAVGMTMDQVKAACGNPKREVMNSDGSASWVYSDAEKAWIPYYMLSGGKIHYVTVDFDTSGKVKSWSSSDYSRY